MLRPLTLDWKRHAIPAAIVLIGAAGLASISIFRHNRFASNGFDLGIFDQTIWGYSQLEIIHNSVIDLPNLLGDHFHPVLMLLAPIFWVWDDVRMLLIAQGLLLAAASIPLHVWTRQKLGMPAAVAVQVAFIGFWGIWMGNLWEFHEVVVAVPVLSLAIYATLTRRDGLLWLAVVLGLLTKENVALTFVMLGLYIVVAQRRWLVGGAIGLISAAWFVVVLNLVIPAISGTNYDHWSYTSLGPDSTAAASYLIQHPLESIQMFFDDPRKIATWTYLLAPWLFLPILSPIAPIALPTLAERFWSDGPQYWGLGFHYSLIVAPVLAFAAVDALARLKGLLADKIRPAATAAAAAVALFSVYVTWFEVQVQGELSGYISAERAAEIESCISHIPPAASVAATSAILPHLTHRNDVWQISDRTDQEYLAIDFSTSVWPLTREQLSSIVADAVASDYEVLCANGPTVVLKRGSGTALQPWVASR